MFWFDRPTDMWKKGLCDNLVKSMLTVYIQKYLIILLLITIIIVYKFSSELKFTFRNENINISRFCVCSLTRIISTICINDVMYCQSARATPSVLCIDYNSTSTIIVVYHFFVVIPEHILWRLWTLKTHTKKNNVRYL